MKDGRRETTKNGHKKANGSNDNMTKYNPKKRGVRWFL